MNGSRRERTLCQSMVRAAAGAGDSGAPVFKFFGTTAQLSGIHWGTVVVWDPIAGQWINGAVFSPIRNVEIDLGPLTVP